ncbi:MAG: DASH family cryptochrome [Acidocella sp.]|nr:DASH family cryptochrome [Acidocella sp.]
MTIAIFWFRNDLRLADNVALAAACANADELLLIYVKSPDETMMTPWGFPRWGAHRLRFRDQALEGLRLEVDSRGGSLLVQHGYAEAVLPVIARQIGAAKVFCETISAPEETAQVAALREAGLEVHEVWQSSLLNPEDLPFDISGLPDVFSNFRQAVERANVSPRAALAAPEKLPPTPQPPLRPHGPTQKAATPQQHLAFSDLALDGSAASALLHVERYFGSSAPQSYKQTRNGLTGSGYSTKLSPWLAVGALSPRTVFQYLKAHEARRGANDSTYWIWFELLWRDYFRFWSLKHGVRLFRASGLSKLPPPGHDPDLFSAWCAGMTGHGFVDAGLRDLSATGFLSNRMRQVVASYLIHDLACDWRAGAAWFESQLIDYDVCSNHGNWLYIAGRGADPRQGRRFNPDKQASDYDPDGAYRALWGDPQIMQAT